MLPCGYHVCIIMYVCVLLCVSMLPCVCVTMYVSVKERRGMCVNGQMSVLLLCI